MLSLSGLPLDTFDTRKFVEDGRSYPLGPERSDGFSSRSGQRISSCLGELKLRDRELREPASLNQQRPGESTNRSCVLVAPLTLDRKSRIEVSAFENIRDGI